MYRVPLPTVDVRGADRSLVFVQGGMGAGISLARLAGAVARRGGIGTVSFVALDRFVQKRVGKKVGHREAAAREIEEARRLSLGAGAIALNAMVLVERTFSDSVLGAVDGGVDAILAGAGLPLALPELVGSAPVALIPIVSSGRALELICRRWRKVGRTPDAVVLEGPLAGGHLGFKAEDVSKPEFRLEELFGPVKDAARANGDFPVIVAGGIYTREDIVRWVNVHGADGVQMGTRFLATEESGATDEFKQAVVACTLDDITVASGHAGSPSGMPFRVIRSSPGYLLALADGREPRCDKGYLLHKAPDGSFTCLAKESCEKFCICNVLLSAAGCNPTGDEPIFTVGENAWRIDRIMPVDALMDELLGLMPDPA